MTGQSTDFAALKANLKTTWTSGNYGKVAEGLAAGAKEFVSRIPIRQGARVLDIACGAGQLAIPAARAGARVTGMDIAENWIEQARQRARSEEVDVQFDVADAEDLPYDDASFDLTASLIGAMFAPRPERVAEEMKRVTCPGGRIVMGNWLPEGFIAGFFKIVAGYVPPPDSVPSPLLWGDVATVRKRLERGIASLDMTEQPYVFRYPYSPEEVVDFYARNFGPIVRAMDALDDDSGRALQNDLLQHWHAHNQADDGTTQVTAEILEVVAVRP